jgi:hypothetical protein
MVIHGGSGLSVCDATSSTRSLEGGGEMARLMNC